MTPVTTFLADPAWRYDQKIRMADGVARSSDDQYSTMSVEEICALYTPISIDGQNRRSGGTLCGFPVADVAFLWLWVTNPFLLDGSGVRVCRAWGFEPKQIVPWIKGRVAKVPPRDGCHDLPDYDLVLNVGMGHLTRGVTEHLIIATRGKYKSAVQVRNENGLILAPEESVILAPEESVILAPRGKHSAKPAEQYAKIERVCPGPYVELFARQARAGWTAWGNELTGQAGDVLTVHGQPDGLSITRPPADVEWP